MDVEKIIEDTANTVVVKLKMAGLMRESNRTTEEKTEELLKNYNAFCKSSQPNTKKIVENINKALDSIKDDEYYMIIPQMYFGDKSREEVALNAGVDVSTISRHKKMLINQLAAIIFSDEVIMDLFC